MPEEDEERPLSAKKKKKKKTKKLCPDCGMNVNDLKRHHQVAHTTQEATETCPQCDKKFTNKTVNYLSSQKGKVTRVVNTLWLPCLRQGIAIPDACTLMAASAYLACMTNWFNQIQIASV